MRVIFRANDSNILFNTFIWKVKSVSLCAKETSCKPKRTVFKDLQIELSQWNQWFQFVALLDSIDKFWIFIAIQYIYKSVRNNQTQNVVNHK